MNKKTLALLLLVPLLTVTAVGAVTYFTLSQTLTIPTVIQLFQHGTTTPITTSADITNLWTYNAGTFTVTFDIKNPGSTPVTPTVTIPTVGSWAFTTTPLNSIPAGSTLSVTITATPPSTSPGTTSGAFQINVGA